MAEQQNEDQRWESLLLEPREDVNREIKSWLDLSDKRDKANLAKAMLALANTGGGQILIGYKEAGETWQPDMERPHSIDHYDQDTINGIVEKFADPQFHTTVHHISHPESGDQFPIVEVPGGFRVPIRADSAGPENQHVTYNTYYIRRPGPESAPPKTGREWDELLRRCVLASKDDLLDRMRTIIAGFEEGSAIDGDDSVRELEDWIDTIHTEWQELVENRYGHMSDSPYSHGYWIFSYSIEAGFNVPELPELLDLLREAKGHETGWPAWLVSEDQVHPKEGTIEGWYDDGAFDDPAHSDYWRATPGGLLFLLRGYQEDSNDGYETGEVFDFILPIWRIGECLLHAKRLSRELCNGPSDVVVEARWNGLEDRKLAAIENRRGIFPPHDRQSHQDTVTVSNRFSTDHLKSNLPEAVEALTQPLYQTFDFYEVPSQLIQKELDQMQSN